MKIFQVWDRKSNRHSAILIASLAIVVILARSLSALAVFNKQINYQGKLTTGANIAVVDGDYNMEFKLYTASSGGTAIWTETRTGANKVTVKNGLFSIMLGSVNSLSGVDFNQTLYLGINIGGTGTPVWDGEMTPRKVLGAVPAAVTAENVGGFLPSQSATGNQIPVLTSGSLLLGDVNPAISATGGNTLTIQGGGVTGNIQFFSAANSLSSAGNMTLASSLSVPSVNGGSTSAGNLILSSTTNGTKGKILLGSSSAFVESTNRLGIGTTAPGGPLHVVLNSTYDLFYGIGAVPNYQVGGTFVRKTSTIASGSVLGSLQFNGTLDSYATGPFSGAEIQGVGDGPWTNGSSTPGRLDFFTTPSGTTTPALAMTIKSTGNVGIGTSNPTAKLQVIGGTTGADTLLGLGTRFTFSGDGVMKWGSGAANGYLSWDTGKAIIGGFTGMNLALAAGANERMTILATGNVGIGTTNPAYPLTVVGSVYANTSLIVNGYAGVNNSLSYTSGSLYLEGSTGGQIYLRPNGTGSNTGLFTFSGTGFASAGTGASTIAGSLAVAGNNAAYGKLQVNATTLGSNVMLALATMDGTYNPRILISHETSTTSQYLKFDSSYSSGTGYANWVFNSGNVGIGTTSPLNQLSLSRAFNGTNNNVSLSLINTDPAAWGTGIGFFDQTSSQQMGYIGMNYASRSWTAGRLSFSVNDDSADTPIERMSILANGNVGIGTTTPSGKLSVANGQAHFEAPNQGQININDDTTAIKIGPAHNRLGAGYYMAGLGFNQLLNYNGITSTNGINQAWIGLYSESTVGTELASLVFATKGGTTSSDLPLERMRITSNGNVGIGTNNPNAKLSVISTAAADAMNVTSVDGTIWHFTQYGEIASSNGIGFMYDNNVGRYTYSNYGDTYITSGINSASASNIILKPSGNGNVGIGTTTPSNPLTVVGTSTNSAVLKIAGAHPSSSQYGLIADIGENGNGNLRIYTANSGQKDFSTWANWNTATSRWEAQATTTVGATRQEFGIDGSITFFTQPSTAVTAGDALNFNTTLRMLGNGNVGIGDSNPASLFTVGNGDLFQVNSSGAIAAATGITSSGTITFSALGSGIAHFSPTGVLSSSPLSLSTDVSGVLTGTNGGTGVNNGTKMITLGGNLTTAGAFNTTLTSTNTTSVTLPTSGTLYGTATGSITSAQLATSLSNETGTGVAVFGTSPTFTTGLTTPLVIGGTAVTSVLSLKGTTGNGTLTSPAIQALVGNNGATNALTILNNGNVGIGSSAPSYKLEVGGVLNTWGDIYAGGIVTSKNGMQTYYQAANNYSGGIDVYKRGNANDINGAIVSGGEIGYHNFYAWDGTAYGRGSLVLTSATQDWTSTAHGTNYSIFVTPNNSINPTQALLINQDSSAIFYGNVGIGTTTPASTLQIKSAANQGVVIGTGVNPATPYPSWMGTDGLAVSGSIYAGGNYIVNDNVGMSWGNSQVYMAGYSESTGTNYWKIATNNVDRLYIDGNGNVGIGTTNPSNKLEVWNTVTPASGNGVFAEVGEIGSGANVKVGAISPAGDTSVYPGIWFNQATPDASNYAFWYESGQTNFNALDGHRMEFRIANQTHFEVDTTGVTINGSGNTDSINPLTVNNATNTQTLLSVLNSGNVGIGTTTPANALSVIGNFDVSDSTTTTKGYRFRTSGAALDFEGAGADLYLSTWSGAGFTGTQYQQIRFDSDGAAINVYRDMNIMSGTLSILDLAGGGARCLQVDNYGSISTTGSACATSSQWTTSGSNVYYNSGNIGIGTTTPSSLLSVGSLFTVDTNGNLTTRGIISSPGTGSSSEKFGAGSQASGNSAIAFGNSVNISGDFSSGFGYDVTIDGNYSTAFGSQTMVHGDDSLVLGESSTIDGTAHTVSRSILLGTDNYTSSSFVVAIGGAIHADYQNVFLVGVGAAATAPNQVVIGSDGTPKNDVYFGKGVTNGSPTAYTIHGTGGSGTDIAGGNLSLAGGIATGSANGGSILFQTSTVGASGTTAQALATRATILANGNFGIGTITPSSALDVNGIISVKGTPIINLPDQSTFSGSLFVGNGGSSLSHTGGADGQNNTSLGLGALYSNTTGDTNTAVGYSALSSNTIGTGNTALGAYALISNISGNDNTAIGVLAMQSNTSGGDNVVVGTYALSSNTTGNANVAIGNYTLSSNTTGSSNTAFGYTALQHNVGGNSNMAIGDSSLRMNTSGSYNVATGSYSLYSNTTGGNNVGIGYSALTNSTVGDNNTALGSYTLYSNTTGNSNMALGYAAMQNNIDGSSNIAIGDSALRSQTSGVDNIAIGNGSLNSSTTATDNTALGNYTLQYNTTGIQNVAFGEQAGYGVSGGSNINYNSLFGYQAGISLLTGGDYNTLLGFRAGNNITTGNNNIMIGNAVNPVNATDSNKLNIGNTIYGDLSSGKVGIGTNSPVSDLTLGGNGAKSIGRNVTSGNLDFYGGTDYTNGAYFKVTGSTLNANPGNSSGEFTIGEVTGTYASNFAINSYNGSVWTPRLVVFGSTGNVGIGTTSPSYNLQVGNSSVTGVVARFQNSTGTCDINPTTSSLACSSDINLKKNITLLDTDNTSFILNSNLNTANLSTLDKVLALNPVTYNWKTENDTDSKHTGFIAQEVEQVFPDLVSTDSNGLKSLNYAGFTPILAQAIKEMNLKITGLSDVTKANSWRDAITNWLASATNGIQQIFAKKVQTEEICSPTTGRCANVDQILDLLNNTSNTSVGTSSSSSTQSTSSTTTTSGDSSPTSTDATTVSPTTSTTTSTSASTAITDSDQASDQSTTNDQSNASTQVDGTTSTPSVTDQGTSETPTTDSATASGTTISNSENTSTPTP